MVVAFGAASPESGIIENDGRGCAWLSVGSVICGCSIIDGWISETEEGW